MKTIPLTKGYFTKVDDEDYEKYATARWFANISDDRVCARRFDYSGKTRKSIYLHREIMGNPIGKHIDHINGDSLDNRKQNLRVCTSAENSRNQKLRKNNTSGYKGVAWHKHSKMWRVAVCVDGFNKTIGYFKNKKMAITAYNESVKKLHGEYARPNEVK